MIRRQRAFCVASFVCYKTSCRNILRTPRNELSDRHLPLQPWWKLSAYSTAGSQAAALNTSGEHTEASPALPGLHQNQPKLEGEGGLLCFVSFTEKSFCSKIHSGEKQGGCKPLKGVDGQGHSLRGSLAKAGLALLCWNGPHAIACKCRGPDLTVSSCVSLPCPPGPCHHTGKVCLYLFFRIPQAPSAVSASYYPPAPESSAGASHRAAGHPCFGLCCEMGQALCSTG